MTTRGIEREQTMGSVARMSVRGWLVLIACSAAMLLGGQASAAKQPQQQTFATPQAAAAALKEAMAAGDRPALRKMFGPGVKGLLSGDPVQDAADFESLAARMADRIELGKPANNRITLYIGDLRWPFPVPLLRQGKRWRFDTAAGAREVRLRRIGRNELEAMRVAYAIYLAQLEYQAEPREGGERVYASRILSSPGRRDGLYWPTSPGELPSPLGLLVAQASAEGYAEALQAGKPAPYHGYFYRLLARQGPNAPGGERSYLVNGQMTGGFALVAYPAEWRSSGVMTFIMDEQGRLYQKNMGSDTVSLARAMEAYDPDPSWTGVPFSAPEYVTGSVTAGGPVPLEAGSHVEVYLVDVTNAESPLVVGKQIITDAAQIPFRFQVEYDPAAIEPGNSYVIAVSVRAGGQLRWKQTQPVAVLTNGHPRYVEVQLTPTQA
jgi:uncharacterized lipoprotein YbaY